jgi:hypothetical protein
MRSVGLVFVVLAGVLVALAPGLRAAGSTWTQSDWSGSSGQQAWSGASSFDTSLNLVTSTANQLTLGQTMATGTGDDGAITVTGTTNLNTQNLIAGRSCADGGDAVDYLLSGSVAANASSLTLTRAPAAGCLTNGDEILVIYMQGGASSDPSSVGEYETDLVASISGATLSLQTPLVNGYSASDGNGHAQAVMVQRVPNYTNVTIQGGATLTASAWNGSTGGVLFFRASGTVTVHGSIDADGLGYAGGAATAPASSGEWAKTGEGVLPSKVASGGVGNKDGGGGGIANKSGVNDSSGGGGGGNAGNGGAGAGKGVGGGSPSGSGAAFGTVSLTQLLLGGGGGAGGGADSGCTGYSGTSYPAVAGGDGGAGGGVVVISAGTITSDGTIKADGSNGAKRPLNPNNPNAANLSGYNGDGDPPCGGGGGGGAGGSIFLSAASGADLASGTLSATGGNGGAGVYFGGAGGGGGGGAILLSVISAATLGTSVVTAPGGVYGTPTSGGQSGTAGSSGAVTIWRPTSATISGSTSPAFTAQQASTYQRNGSLTSSIFDSGSSAGADWGTLAYTSSAPSGTSVAVRVRTGNQSNLSDASSFSSCPAISSGTSLAGTSCVTQGDRYAQYQVALTGAGTSTPSVTQVSVSYTVIPSTTSGGSSQQTTTTSAPATTTATPATSVPRPTAPPKPVPPRLVTPKPAKGVPRRGKPRAAPAITVNLPPLGREARSATARSATAAAKLPRGVHVKAYSWTVDGAAAGNGAKLSYRFSRHNHWYRVTLRARLSTGVVAKTGVLVDSVRVVRAMRAHVHYVYAATTATNGVAEQTAEVAATVTKARRGLTQASIAIECTGYSSASAPRGVHDPASELALSRKRAAAACRLLRRSLGTAGLTYVERGRGGADAVGDNTTAAGRAANRRVAITVTITGWAVKPDGRPR